MKKILILLSVILVALVFGGCAGKMYQQSTTLDNGMTIIQGGRTGVFGADNGFVYIAPTQPEEQKITILKKVYTRSSTTWTDCSSKTPNKNAKNIKREELRQTLSEEVVPPTPESSFWAGGNPSVGNSLLPATAVAGGMIGAAHELKPSETNITGIGNGGCAEANADADSISSSYSNSDSGADVEIDID